MGREKGSKGRSAAAVDEAGEPGDGFQMFSSSKKRKTSSSRQQVPKNTALLGHSVEERGAPAATDATGAASTSETQDTEAPGATFGELGVSEWLQGVCRNLGMEKPTEVQRGCIPAVLAGRDVLGTAQTGSGKTAAFALPILQKLAKEPYGIYALVLTPTRELAFQLADQFRALGAGMKLKDCIVIGGMEIQQQCKALSQRPHVVIATPGRLRDLIQHDEQIKAAFRRTSFLVLDEADRLLEPSFETELSVILEALPQEGRQTLLFSATMTKSLTVLAEDMMSDAFKFAAYEGLRTADRLRQEYVFMPAKVKEVYLAYLLENLAEMNIRSAIIFTGTKRGCELLQEILTELDIQAVSLHSNKPQAERLKALEAFRSRLAPILLATDVASRGLDIPTVDLVINFDLPTLARDYVHRVGRTARAGRKGWCLSFVTQYDVDLVHKVEALINSQLEKYSMAEDEVLKGITKVYAAKRTAAMTLAEQRPSGGGGGPKIGRAAR